jgi:ribosomal protein S18 acetylase RimI-like enzyme
MRKLGNVTVREFEQGDLDFAYEMLVIEEWNDRREDAERMLDYEPEGCFMAEVNRERAGHIFSISYASLAWIGYVIVKAKYRNRGIATLLMKKALDYLRSKHVQTVKLEAVPEIADLYRKLGFTDEYDSLRLVGTSRTYDSAKGENVKPMIADEIAEVAMFDEKYFGADRSKVLTKLFQDYPELCFVSHGASGVEGYVMCRRAEFGYKLGPWVCKPENPEAAKRLLLECLSAIEPESKIFIGAPAPNKTAIEILQKLGFEQHSRSIRMRHGKTLNDRISGIFAIGGPMKG